MGVISVTITESDEQIVAGIPRFVIINTNISCTIFYTFDGTEPTIFSDIYIDELILPVDRNPLILKILATNGIDFVLVTEEYYTNILDNTRLPHSSTDAPAQDIVPDYYPFGTNAPQPDSHYLNNAGITIDDEDLTQIPSGFDANQNPAAFTNENYDITNYEIIYSNTNSIHQTGENIGNLTEVDIAPPITNPKETSYNANIYNPKAKVIFYDDRNANPNDPPFVNKQFFILQDLEKSSDANHLFSCGLDAPTVSGSFVRCHYNPVDNTDTYYFFDSAANRWIISKSEHKPVGDFDGNLSGVQSSRCPGDKYIHPWVPYARRTLF